MSKKVPKRVNNSLERITDMPKLHSPFVRKEIDGDYVVTPEVNDGFEWVFKEAKKVRAIEKLHGTNVSVVIKNGNITSVFNRKTRIKPYTKSKQSITKGILNSIKRGYLELEDGQWFGEVIGPKINGNPHNLKKHYWIPFKKYCLKHLEYKSYGEHPTDFDSLSDWFKNTLFSLFHSKWHGTSLDEASVSNGVFCEGIVFWHPDGRLAKLRRDMFDWYEGDRH